MIIPVGSTEAITLGPFQDSSGALVTTGTPSIVLYVRGVVQSAIGTAGAVDANGYAKFTPNAADTATTGSFGIKATLSGALAYFRNDQVGETGDQLSSQLTAGEAAILAAIAAIPSGGGGGVIVQVSTDTEASIQTLINDQYVLLSAEQVLYSSLQAQRTALASPDVSSIVNGGEGGSESYSVATLTEQLSQSAARLRELQEELKRLMELKNMRFPWVKQPCHRRFWGGW